MSRPAIAGVMSSGWHLHQSLTERRQRDATPSPATTALLAIWGAAYLAGLLAHARGAAVFTTPTVNGYKRYRPMSLAPDRILWGEDNKGAMVRVGRRPADAPGEPVRRARRQPVPRIASQVVSGLDGVDRGLDPGEPTTAPVRRGGAAAARRASWRRSTRSTPTRCSPTAFGADVVSWITTLKRAEVTRYLQAVTDWEQREYYDLL